MKKISVYIDGQNTYHALKRMGVKSTSKYDYMRFISALVPNNRISYIGYYVGQIQPNDAQSKRLYEGQQRFLNELERNISEIVIHRGKILRINNSNEKCEREDCPKKEKPHFYEKGVDVRMAIDIVHDAIRDEYDEAYLFSSDSDLIPAIERVQEKGKSIHYIGFQKQKSIALMKKCNTKKILSKEECFQFSRY